MALPCLRCGYDLRALPIEKPCPECGLAIERTLAADSLADTSRPYQRAVYAGLLTAQVALSAMFLLTLAVPVLERRASAVFSPRGFTSSSEIMEQAIIATAAGLIAVLMLGWWCMARAGPHGEGRRLFGGARPLLLYASAVAMILWPAAGAYVLFDMVIVNTGVFGILIVAAPLAPLSLIIALSGFAEFARQLARLVSDDWTARWAPLVALFIVPGILVPTLGIPLLLAGLWVLHHRLRRKVARPTLR